MAQSKNKKWLYIGLAVLVVGGVVGYVLYKRKKDNQIEGQGGGAGDVPAEPQLEPTPKETQKQNSEAKDLVKLTSAPVITKDKPIKTTVSVPASVEPKGTTTATLVSAIDLLAGNPKGANQKQIFAQIAGLPIYNANGVKSKVTAKGAFLGVAYMAKKTSYGNYRIYFKTAGGVAYNMPDIGVLVRTN